MVIQSANKPVPKWCRLPLETGCWNIIAGHAIRQGRKCCRNCDYIDPPYKGANASHSTMVETERKKGGDKTNRIEQARLTLA